MRLRLNMLIFTHNLGNWLIDSISHVTGRVMKTFDIESAEHWEVAMTDSWTNQWCVSITVSEHWLAV